MPKPECPSPEQLQALVAADLPEDSADAIFAHLETCRDCRSTVDARFRQNKIARGSAREPIDEKPVLNKSAFQRAVAQIEQFGSSHAGGKFASGNNPRARRAQRDLAGEQVGQYEILAKLGEGGMGVVYKARDLRLKRLVALKLVQLDRIDHDALARFRSEAETIAKLSHANIVQIYEVGEYEGLPYFALELVEAGSLSEHAKGNPLPAREAAAIVMALGHATEYAHQHGVVHRDLKPGNVLVSSPLPSAANIDSTQRKSGANLNASGADTVRSPTLPAQTFAAIPKITDFGLAKNLECDSDLTRSGAIMGTPSYMAPEQARGDNSQVGTSCDIYALGAILYALVTGCPPFVGENYVQTIAMVTENEPLPPTRLQPRLPKDIETICLKCLSKQPAKRYDSAGELSNDLERFLTGNPILARPISSAERVAKFVRRRPAVATIVALVAAILFIGMPGMTALYVNSEFHRRAAVESEAEEVQAKAQAQESERNAKQQVARLRAAQGVALVKEKRLFDSLVWTASAWEAETRLQDDVSERASHAEEVQQFRFVATLQQCPALVASWNIPGWNGLRNQIHFSSDGRFLNVQTPNSRIQSLRMRAISGDAVPLSDGLGDKVLTRRMTRDCRIEAAVYQDFRIKVWDVADGKTLHELAIPKEQLGMPPHETLELCRVEITPDHRFVVVAIDRSHRGVVPAIGVAWDLKSGKLVWHAEIGPWAHIQIAQDGQQVLFGNHILWNARTGEVKKWKLSLELDYSGARLSDDGRWIAYVYLFNTQRSGGTPKHPDGTLHVRDTTTGEYHILQPPHRKPITLLEYGPMRRWFLAGDTDGLIHVWDTSTWRLQSVFQNRGLNWKPCFSPDGRWVALSHDGKSVRVWDVENGQPVTAPLPHSEVVRDAAWAPNGRQLAVLGMNGSVRMWDLARQAEPAKTLDHGSPVNVIRFSPDDRLLATGCLDTTARVWNTASGDPIGVPMRHEHSVISLSWNHIGNLLATVNGRNSYGLHGNAYQIWHPSSGTAISPPSGRQVATGFGVGRVQFSPTANRLLVQYAGDANLLDLPQQREAVPLLKHPGRGGALFGELTYSAGGRRLITLKNSVCVWQMPSDKLLLGHNDRAILLRNFEFEEPSARIGLVHDVAASRDGHYFAMATSTGLSVLELPADLKKMRAIIQRPDQGPIGRVAFDRASRRLLSVDINGVCQLWNLRSAKPVGPRWQTGGSVRLAEFGPSGQWIVTVLATGKVQLWDPQTGQSLGPPHQHGAAVNNAEISHNGLLLATAGVDGAVRLWNLRRWNARQYGRNPPKRLSQVARFLSVRSLDGDALGPLNQKELASFDFDRARREFPKMFSVTRQEAANWHKRQAADCQARKQSDAATFHLNQAKKHAN